MLSLTVLLWDSRCYHRFVVPRSWFHFFRFPEISIDVTFLMDFKNKVQSWVHHFCHIPNTETRIFQYFIYQRRIWNAASVLHKTKKIGQTIYENFFWIGAGKYRTKCWSSCKADYSVNAVKGDINKFHGDANCIVYLAEKGYIQISSSMTKLEKM